MGVILSLLGAFLYATACMIVCGCGYQPPSRFEYVADNVLMFFFAVAICSFCFMETNPETTGGYVAFGVYCLIMFLLWLLQMMVSRKYIINKNRVYDFRPMGTGKYRDGKKVYVGYIDNGISKSAVIVDNYHPADLTNISFKVRYSGNAGKQPLNVEFYDKEKQRYVVHHFNIHVNKVEV